MNREQILKQALKEISLHKITALEWATGVGKTKAALTACMQEFIKREKEKKDFKKRWDDIQALLANKPMITELDNFIKYLNIDISNFPISIKDIRKMRNDLSHGSIEKYNEMKLTQANILLFGIIGVIILKAFGIENLDLKNIVDKAKTIC